MARSLCLVLLLCLVSSAFATQGFIEGGFHLRLGDYHPRSGIGLNGAFAFNRVLNVFHPELMAGGWFGIEGGGDAGFPGYYTTARLDDTASNRTFADQRNAGLLATGRIVFDFDRTNQSESKLHPVIGIGIGGYQLFRKSFPAREASMLAELFFRLHFARKAGDTYLQISGVRSFGVHRDNAINASFPKFAYAQISLGFELPVRRTVQTH